ncbi:MAG: hypothetical protein AB7O52_04470 [Planctomycetota bacterium]
MHRDVRLVLMNVVVTCILLWLGSTFFGGTGVALPTAPAPGIFVWGDANCDGSLNISDPVTILGYLFSSAPLPPACAQSFFAPDQLATLQEILPHLSRVELDDGLGGTVPTIRLTGVNLQIVNGSGATNGNPASPNSVNGMTNGTGNLIVGYNEFGTGGNNRTGSHNLVVGSALQYERWGGAVLGQGNVIRGAWSSVTGGNANTAIGDYAAITGGLNNEAAGDYSSISGGQFNASSGDIGWVGGGNANEAAGVESCVSGGASNTALGAASAVSGGEFNSADGDRASVAGGRANSAVGLGAVVVGGQDNFAGGVRAAVFGGQRNEADGTAAVVVGGGGPDPFLDGNRALGDWSVITGGRQNDATGNGSTVGGGRQNVTAPTAEYSVVAGGCLETTFSPCELAP